LDVKKKLLQTAGYVTIGLGIYMVYKGSEIEPLFKVKDMDNVIDIFDYTVTDIDD